ncbi:MAG: hypothetical protein HKM06_01700 [Spirochaetales bacterium]|nr:hypothetical protein [Spirochaetales bacterium]
MTKPTTRALILFLITLGLLGLQACSPQDSAQKLAVTTFLTAAQKGDQKTVMALVPSLSKYPPAQRQEFFDKLSTIKSWTWLGVKQNGVTRLGFVELKIGNISERLGIPLVDSPKGWLIGDHFQVIQTIPRIELQH